MKRLILITALFLFGCGVAFTNVPDSPNVKTRYYDKRGNYQGYSIKSETGTTRYYDKNGKYTGSGRVK